MRARGPGVVALVACAALGALGACVKTEPFVCATDDQCGAGRCEADGACSFADATCHGAWRYGDDGDPAVAGRCVGDTSGPIGALAAGSDHACARADDGRVWCWGDNPRGGLAREDVARTALPTAVPDLAGVTDLDGGEYTTCAIADGVVTCWGQGDSGELGDGEAADRPRPRSVGDLTAMVEVELGEHHACARDGGGVVWCWGSNGDRETGAPGAPRR